MPGGFAGAGGLESPRVPLGGQKGGLMMNRIAQKRSVDNEKSKFMIYIYMIVSPWFGETELRERIQHNSSAGSRIYPPLRSDSDL